MLRQLKNQIRIIGWRLYRLLVAGVILGLVWFFVLRKRVPVTWKPYGDPLSFTLIISFVLMTLLILYRRHFRYRDMTMAQVDMMDGVSFEDFCVYLLRHLGYKRLQTTQASGDQGLDVLGRKDGKLVGVQCKRYTGYVGNKAVQEAWSGHEFYRCDSAMVITNSEFSDSAIELAESLGVTLVDRNRLRRLMRRLPR